MVARDRSKQRHAEDVVRRALKLTLKLADCSRWLCISSKAFLFLDSILFSVEYAYLELTHNVDIYIYFTFLISFSHRNPIKTHNLWARRPWSMTPRGPRKGAWSLELHRVDVSKVLTRFYNRNVILVILTVRNRLFHRHEIIFWHCLVDFLPIFPIMLNVPVLPTHSRYHKAQKVNSIFPVVLETGSKN